MTKLVAVLLVIGTLVGCGKETEKAIDDGNDHVSLANKANREGHALYVEGLSLLEDEDLKKVTTENLIAAKQKLHEARQSLRSAISHAQDAIQIADDNKSEVTWGGRGQAEAMIKQDAAIIADINKKIKDIDAQLARRGQSRSA